VFLYPIPGSSLGGQCQSGFESLSYPQNRLRGTHQWVYTDACPTCRDSWPPTGRILKPHLHAAKFSAESTSIRTWRSRMGPWNLPNSADHRAGECAMQACLHAFGWKAGKGGQGVPAPVGHQGTFCRFSESDSSNRPMPTATKPMPVDRRDGWSAIGSAVQ
jgi:hypothetical protein